MNMNLFEFDNLKLMQKSPLGIVLSNFDNIIGCDEAGRGPAAGGVWASAVCFKKDVDIFKFQKLNDSKKLSAKTREELYDLIIENSYFSIQEISIAKIEEINILNASLLGMELAIYDVLLKINNDNFLALIDGNKLIKNFQYSQEYIVKGDSKSASIAAASILAKVTRDRFMDEIHKQYPMYNWQSNKGYLTKEHIEAIKKYGISPYHRKSFLKNIL